MVLSIGFPLRQQTAKADSLLIRRLQMAHRNCPNVRIPSPSLGKTKHLSERKLPGIGGHQGYETDSGSSKNTSILRDKGQH